MRLAWATDIHLEWLNDTLEQFLTSLAESETDGLIVSGDISYRTSVIGGNFEGWYHIRSI